MTHRRALFLLTRWLTCVLILSGCDEYPKDPADTLEEVRGGVLRVGLLERPPWVTLAGAEPGGIEVALVRALAVELDARIDWVTPTQGDVLDALMKRELHVVVGGLTERNPWSAHLGFTRPYYEEDLVVAAPELTRSSTIEEQPVLVDPGTTEPALVQAKGGVPVSGALADQARLIAKPAWQLEPGETPVVTLHTDRHVFAVPKGENAFLIRVDRFLREHADTIGSHLREIAR